MKYTESRPQSGQRPSKQLFHNLWLIFMLITLTACGGLSNVVQQRAFHSLEFQPKTDSVDIQALFYRYGSSNEFGMRTSAEQAVIGESVAGISISGNLPIGEDFYVKWRVISSGRIYEDLVDLRSRLPLIMTKQEIRPIIEGGQLYIYLISFDEVRPLFTYSEASLIQGSAKTRKQQILAEFARRKVIQIYPIRVVDPQLPEELKK